MDHISINNFDGPLDLLLHLIKEANVSIYDISIEEITDKYLEYIHKEKELNINVSSSYLVMATELMYIKSKSLLPSIKVEDDESEQELNRDNLINKLVEYKKYKEVTSEFKKLEERRQEIFTKIPENYSNYAEETEVKNMASVDDLINAFKLFLDRKELEKPLDTTVTNKEYSVKERKKKIREYLKLNSKAYLDELIDEYSRPYLVVTFLSVLEMVKENDIIIKQDRNFDKILIEVRGK